MSLLELIETVKRCRAQPGNAGWEVGACSNEVQCPEWASRLGLQFSEDSHGVPDLQAASELCGAVPNPIFNKGQHDTTILHESEQTTVESSTSVEALHGSMRWLLVDQDL